jgi:putative FmdB family regulatory protein
MPLYDYQCNQCEATFEVHASFQEKEVGLKPVCPNCKSVDTHQVLTVGLLIRSEGTDAANSNSFSCDPNAGPGCCGG